jgi:hypothetical protein
MAELPRDSHTPHEGRDEADELYARLNTVAGARALNALSAVTTEDLVASYKPGATETGATER